MKDLEDRIDFIRCILKAKYDVNVLFVIDCQEDCVHISWNKEWLGNITIRYIMTMDMNLISKLAQEVIS